MKTRVSRVLGTAFAAIWICLPGTILAQKASLPQLQERVNAGELQMHVSEEPRSVNIGIEVTGIGQAALSAGLDPAHEINGWAKIYAELPVHELTISGRNPIIFQGIPQQNAGDPVEIVLLAEDANDLEACRQMATSLLPRSPSSPFGGQQKPLLFYIFTDKAYVRSIYNPWNATRVTVPLKSKTEVSPTFVKCYLWNRDIWGIP